MVNGNLKQIDAGSGSVVGVNNNNEIFVLIDNIFTKISGSLKHFSVGPAGQLGVNTANNIFRFQSGGFVRLEGEDLQRTEMKTSLSGHEFTCCEMAKYILL